MRWLPYQRQDPSPYDDDWEDQPPQGSFYQYASGLLVPAAMVFYGLTAIATQRANVGGRWSPLFLHGTNAIAYGVAWTSAAIFLHCHYFWGNLYNQAWPAVLGKILGACGFIAGMAVVLVRNGVLGIH